MKRNSRHYSFRLLAFALLLLGAGAAASAQEKSVVVVGKDGTTRSVALGKVERIDIGAASLTLHDRSGSSSEHAYGEVDRVLIGELSSIIEQARRDGTPAIWPLPFAEKLNIAGATAGAEIGLYDLRGTRVAAATADAEGSVSLSTGSLAAGVYLLSCGEGKAVKVVKH